MEDETIKEYLANKDIVVTGFSFKGSVTDYSEERVINHVRLINAMHKILMGYGISSSINSSIGRKIEKIKVEVKRLRRSLDRIECKNSIDEFLINNGEFILKQSEVALGRFNEINYMDLVKRSMRKNEICLGRVDESNIRAVEDIEIGIVKNITYNLVEEDICNYLKKVKIKNKQIDLEYVIDSYIKMSNLSLDSKEYMKVLLLIPVDTMKYWKKYLKCREKIDSQSYLNSMKETYNYEVVM